MQDRPVRKNSDYSNMPPSDSNMICSLLPDNPPPIA